MLIQLRLSRLLKKEKCKFDDNKINDAVEKDKATKEVVMNFLDKKDERRYGKPKSAVVTFNKTF